MSCTPRREPCCNSKLNAAPTECCMEVSTPDGHHTDAIAAEEPRGASNTRADHLLRRAGHCQEMNIDSCSQHIQPTSQEKLSQNGLHACRMEDDSNVCRSSLIPEGHDRVIEKRQTIATDCRNGNDGCCLPEQKVGDEGGRTRDTPTTAAVQGRSIRLPPRSADEFATGNETSINSTEQSNSTDAHLGRKDMRSSGSCCSTSSRALVPCDTVPIAAPCCTSSKAPATLYTPEIMVRYDSENGRDSEQSTVSQSTTQSLARTGCCSSKKKPRDIEIEKTAAHKQAVVVSVAPVKYTGEGDAIDNNRDLEKGTARQAIVISIAGMTCTGCAKKVLGVLHNIEGVGNVKVNFVAATASLEVDQSKISAAVVLQRLEKETGFKCSRIVTDRQTLDLNLTPIKAQIFATNLPHGVDALEKIGKESYRLSYDPSVIGARAVLASSGGHLAPATNNRAVSDGQRKLVSMLFSFLCAATFTIPVCVLAFSSVLIPLLNKGIIELVLATCVQLIAVKEFYMPALKALIFSKVIEMDMLVVISVTAAYGYSVVAFALQSSGVHLEQGTLFETSTLLTTLVLLGRLVTIHAKFRAVKAVAVNSLQAETAVLEGVQGQSVEIDARLLEFNDVIRVPAHSKIVSDGQILSGESVMDESMLTGESLSVPKSVGDSVIAGTVNGHGALRVKLTRLPGKNSINDIANLVQNALNSKPRVQDMADIVASHFVPVVMSVSLVVFSIWVAVALRVRHQEAGAAIGTAITYTIAVLAISCPCAIGLAVPLVLVIAGGVAARNGVLIKQADVTEKAFKVTDIVFDKTGTLTTGQLEVTQQVVLGGSVTSDVALAVAYSLVKDDTHPVAQAAAVSLASQDISAVELQTITSFPGCGIQAVWNGQQVKAGSPQWLGIDMQSSIVAFPSGASTVLCISIGGELMASFGLSTTIRPEAQSVIGALQRRGLTCHIVSGDQTVAVSDIAISLGISVCNTASLQSPADKQRYIDRLKTMGKTTLFTGDGTNDAVAVAAADVGVQIGTVSDITRATADVVLLGGLEGIVTLLEISKQSFHRIVFNFVWAGIYNVFAILFASGALVKVRIAPKYAGLGEIVSVLPVVLVALTMLRIKSRAL